MLRMVSVVLTVVFAALQYRLWIADGGLAHTHRLQNEVRQQQEFIDSLRARNQALDAEIADLKSGEAAVESRARAMLGMVRPNETFYLIVNPS